jgi:hypothetical protein
LFIRDEKQALLALEIADVYRRKAVALAFDEKRSLAELVRAQAYEHLAREWANEAGMEIKVQYVFEAAQSSPPTSGDGARGSTSPDT